jgi:hypothetical protein
MTPEERFWIKVNKDGPVIKAELGPCWVWTAAQDKDCYGRFAFEGRSDPAYRVAFEWEYGPLAEGYEPDHLCKYNPCVRPSHMEAVTAKENNTRGHAKLTREDVVEIRHALAEGTSTRKQLAVQYNISYANILLISHGRIWKGVGGELS